MESFQTNNTRRRFLSTLRGRVTAVSIAAIVFVIGAMGATTYVGASHVLSLLVTTRLASDHTMLKKVIDVNLDILQERLGHIVTTPVVEALRDQDRSRLETYAVPPFNRISSLINLTSLRFYIVPGHVFFSTEDSARAEFDESPRKMMIDAFERRAIFRGIDVVDGQMGLFIAWPIYSAGALVGVVQAGGSLQPIVTEIGKTLGVDAQIMPLRTAIEEKHVSSTKSSDSTPDATTATVQSALDRAAVSELTDGFTFNETLGDSHIETSVLPLRGYAGDIAAQVLLGRNVTPVYNSLLQSFYRNIGIAILAMVGALWVILINFSHVFGRLARMVSAIRMFASGRSDFQIPKYRDDEVGQLGDALQTMMANVTETQNELRVSERKANEASIAKSSFIANMSHELRTPLNAIIGYSQLIEDELTGHAELRGKQDAEKIGSAAKSLLNIINDLLDIAKLDSGKMQLESFPIRFSVIAADIIAEGKPLVEATGSRFVSRIAVSETKVNIDPARIKQVLLNLVKNAAKFTRNGIVTFTVTEAPDATNMLVVTIEDTGVGISQESLPGLFNPFSQVDQSTSRQYGGLGLGLAITKRLCDIMGCEIAISSTPGKGTLITIKIPVYKEERIAA